MSRRGGVAIVVFSDRSIRPRCSRGVVAGVQSPLTAMVAGRCSIEGNLALAVRPEAMFGAR